MRLVADLHIHSIASGHAYSTILEIAQAAREAGLEMVAITDHGPKMPGSPHVYHFSNMATLPDKICGVRVLRGVEANIIDEKGSIDLTYCYLKYLDIVLAGFHDPYKCGTVTENTDAMIATMMNPYVDFIVHPGNPRYPVDGKAIVEASIETGVPIEVNNSSFVDSREGSIGPCSTIARHVAELNGRIIISSDAHFAQRVGVFDEALRTIKECGVSLKQVLNTSVEKVMTYLKDRHFKRPLSSKE